MPETTPLGMPATVPAPASCNPALAVPGTTALAALLQRMRQRVWRTAVFMVALCGGIALLLSASQEGHLGRFTVQLAYSFAIGLSCMAAIDATRLALAWLSDRLRARRGLPAGVGTFGRGWTSVVPALLVAAVVGPSLGLWIGDMVTGLRSPSVLQFGNASVRATLVLTLLATAVSVFVFSTQERLSAAQAQAEAAQRLAVENQLRLLQSQLEPHMLFNTLANLRVLIGLDPDRAQAMLDHLIAFLRRTLSASRADRHPLAAEFSHLADYLALMAVRMGPRLQTELDLPAELQAVPLPPLLLQPLVENAIKHGLEPNVAGGRITVTARRLGNQLALTVRDTGVGLRKASAVPNPEASSFGLEQVRTRLATLYGNQAALQLQAADDGDGGTVVSITLPLAASTLPPTPTAIPTAIPTATPIATPATTLP